MSFAPGNALHVAVSIQRLQMGKPRWVSRWVQAFASSKPLNRPWPASFFCKSQFLDTFFGCKNTEVNTCVMPQSFTSLRCEITSWFHDFMGILLHYVNVGHDGKSLPREAGSFPMFNRFVGDSRPDFGKVHQPKLQGPVPPEQFTQKHPAPMSPRIGPWCHPSFLYRHRHPSSSSVEANFETPSPRVKALKYHLNVHFFGSSQTNHLPSILPQIVIQHFALGSKPRYHEIPLSLTCRGLIVVRGSHIFYVVRPIRFGIWGMLILQKRVVEESNIKPHISATVLQEINDQASHSSHASHATHHGRCHVGHISGRNLFGFAISCPGALKSPDGNVSK